MPADDANHISGQLTPIQIGEAIRRKKYGRDMREALAQGFECMFNWYETLHELQGTVKNLNARVETLEENVSNLSEDITDLRQKHDEDVDALTGRINELTETIKKQDARISKLEDAVFGYGEYEVNYETPHHDSSVTEINTDSNPMLKN